jgi:hypothetical protein
MGADGTTWCCLERKNSKNLERISAAVNMLLSVLADGVDSLDNIAFKKWFVSFIDIFVFPALQDPQR